MEKKSSKKSNRESSSSTSSPPPQRTSLAGLDKIVEAECTQTFSRSFERLPIHKDLGRLISKINLIGADGTKLFVGQGSTDEGLGHAVKRFLSVIVHLFDENVAAEFDSQLEKEIKNDERTNLIACLQQFFASVDDVTNVKLRCLKLLKTINQSIVAPGVVNLQLATQGKYGLSDVGWTILVRVFDSHILVDHNRVESVSVSIKSSATMFWRERFLLKADDMSLLQVQLRVTEVDVDDTDPASEGFLDFVKPIYEPTILERVRDIFARDWTKIAIAKDIYRFASTSVLRDHGKDAVVIRQLESDQIKQIKILLIELAKMFNPTIVKLISKKFDGEISKAGSDLTLLLRSFLQDTVQLGGSDPLCRILKFFTQSAVGPISTSILLGISSLLPIKDGGEWRIELVRTDSDVQIIHTKSECSLERTDQSKMFEFSWTAKFVLNLHVIKLKQVSVELVEDSIKFPYADKVSPQSKREIASLIRTVLATLH